MRNKVYLYAIILFLVIFTFSQSFQNESFEDLNKTSVDSFSSSQDLHWTHMPIKYKIKNDYCTNFTADRIRWAFDILSNETNGSISFEELLDNTSRKDLFDRDYHLLFKGEPNSNVLFRISGVGSWSVAFNETGFGEIIGRFGEGETEIRIIFPESGITKTFYPLFLGDSQILIDTTLPSEVERTVSNNYLFGELDRENTDILIKCFFDAPEDNKYWVQAEAVPLIFSPNKIVGGQLYFYNVRESSYSGGCLEYPLTELHEMLHLFNYEHTESGIMAPISLGCSQLKIDDWIIDDLKRIYS